jgi:hypothetical protein
VRDERFRKNSDYLLKHLLVLIFVNFNTWYLICNNFNLNFIFDIVCLIVCVCAFSLHRESPDMILGDEPLISKMVLSHWAPPHNLCRLPCLRPSVEGGDSPFFPSSWQASHYSRVRCNFPPTVIVPERGCGSSPSTTLRRPIASSINIMERSSRDSIE